MPSQTAKKKLLLALTILLALSGLVIWFAWKPLIIYRHRQGLERASYLLLVETDISGRVIQKQYSTWEVLLANLNGMSTESWERYNYHLKALVELGYFAHRQFRFQHIEGDTLCSRKLWKLACAEKNLANDYTTGSTSEGPFEIEVWDTQDKILLWEDFVRKHDVPDFRQRYLQIEQEDRSR